MPFQEGNKEWIKALGKSGRPTKYTDKLAAEICLRIADGESLRNICKDKHMPDRVTIISWAMDRGHDFYNQYADARKYQAELLIDDLIDISDDGSKDWDVRRDRHGNEYEAVNPEVIGRSKLRADTRKWIGEKVLPKFHQRSKVELTGADGGAIKTEEVGDDKSLARSLVFLLNKGAKSKAAPVKKKATKKKAAKKKSVRKKKNC